MIHRPTQGAALKQQEIIKVKGLTVSIRKKSQQQKLLRDLNFGLNRGEIHGLVGESGCGKSLFARTLVRLEAPAHIVSGSIVIDGTNLAEKKSNAVKSFRGKKISLVLQNPAAAMDPLFTMASQFRDALSILPGTQRSMDRVHGLLEELGITSPASRCRQYPHEWSRGMLQRAQLAMALIPAPETIVLDEVTSALDPTITLQLVERIARIQHARGISFIFITHDLALAAHICDRISVMHRGTILESRETRDLFSRPDHPYTRQFVAGTGISGTESSKEALWRT